MGAAPDLPREQEWQAGLEEDWERHGLARISEIERRVELWWKVYAQDVFPLLVPLRKWQKTEEVLDMGAIVLIRYEAKYARDRYRLARVLKLVKSRDGLVRSALVGMRDLRRGAREPRTELRSGLCILTLPVQRMVMVLPGSEQPPSILEDLKLWLEARENRQPTVGRREERVVVRAEDGEEEMLDLGPGGLGAS